MKLKISKDQIRNPLGIVALFISLIYGFASLLLGSSADKLEPLERWPLILFIVIFPFSVLYVFYKLVTDHHGKLYSPSDYNTDDSFLKTLSVKELEIKLEEDVNEAVATQLNTSKNEASVEQLSRADIKGKIRKSEEFVIREIKNELSIEPTIGIKVSSDLYVFDAGYIKPNDELILLEVKYYTRPTISFIAVDEFLHRAKLAKSTMTIKTKFIVAVITEFESDEFDMIKNAWKNSIEKDELDIELRFYVGNQIWA
ncbi:MULTISPECIES: hypothetical protein [unclassified Pseudoalteromonas]|uniref:hypothetical protein n=1 Tax=unclassified Pseudoalteromonas TaxID=194690 RepID=UPI00048F9884|nr:MULTISPECIES: hypothetical protein [unclassified Pseudoalteromonas]